MIEDNLVYLHFIQIFNIIDTVNLFLSIRYTRYTLFIGIRFNRSPEKRMVHVQGHILLSY